MAAPGQDAQISAQMQRFIQQETQVAQAQQLVASLTDICWDKCISSPSTSLSSREQSCLDQCAKRFVDVTQFVMQRAQKQGSGLGQAEFH